MDFLPKKEMTQVPWEHVHSRSLLFLTNKRCAIQSIPFNNAYCYSQYLIRSKQYYCLVSICFSWMISMLEKFFSIMLLHARVFTWISFTVLLTPILLMVGYQKTSIDILIQSFQLAISLRSISLQGGQFQLLNLNCRYICESISVYLSWDEWWWVYQSPKMLKSVPLDL